MKGAARRRGSVDGDETSVEEGASERGRVVGAWAHTALQSRQYNA